MATYARQMQEIVEAYRGEGHAWPASAKAMAGWAITTGRWKLPPSAALNRCAEDLASAMREEYMTDPKGRRVRVKHPAKVWRDGEQFILWDDMRTATRSHMQLSFQNRRHGIVGDCRQLKTDCDSYNDAHAIAAPLQIDFDFTMDLAEMEAASAA